MLTTDNLSDADLTAIGNRQILADAALRGALEKGVDDPDAADTAVYDLVQTDVPRLLVEVEQRPTWAEVETWLKARRDGWYDGEVQWHALDAALDDLRNHFHTGTPLDQPVVGPHGEEG